ncbi:hypothetical protein TWF481_009387 [Arthrobotrys musiformis]|uniref:Zn(2)-C6 fungal-type domain-containing protein n=1 Tax=Arthrobotrys musiformis TaxID=47236 RepID=A0AAV9W3N9_9PEZI
MEHTVVAHSNVNMRRSCHFCRLRKIRCSGQNICSACRERNIDCVYEAESSRGRPKNGIPGAGHVGFAAMASPDADVVPGGSNDVAPSGPTPRALARGDQSGSVRRYIYKPSPEEEASVEPVVRERPTIDLASIDLSSLQLFKKSEGLGSKLEGGGPRWGDDGELGEALGKVLSFLWQTYTEWRDSQGDFVQGVVDGLQESDYVKNNNLNVFVFANDNSQFFFTNWWESVIDDTAWFGILDKSYRVVVFETGWFARYGQGGYNNWCYGWWVTNPQWEHEWDDGDGRVAITYIGRTHNSSDKVPTAWQIYNTWDNESFPDIKPLLMQCNSTASWETTWMQSIWNSSAIHYGKGDDTYVWQP